VSPERSEQRFRGTGDLEKLDILCGLPIDRCAVVAHEPASDAIVLDRSVSALPGLASVPELADPAVRVGGSRVAGDRLAFLAGRQRPHYDIANRPVAELLVEREGARVLDDHLEPDAADATLPSLVVKGAHERRADAGPSCLRHDADAADPGVLAAQAEVAESLGRSSSEGDPRRVEIEVERLGHR
jgi:hypothetical protein